MDVSANSTRFEPKSQTQCFRYCQRSRWLSTFSVNSMLLLIRFAHSAGKRNDGDQLNSTGLIRLIICWQQH